MEINDILLEWSYRLKKGYPTMEDGKFTDPSELKVLHEILKENGINEMPSFVKSKTPVSDEVVRTLNEAKTQKDIFKLISKLNIDDEQTTKLYDRIKTFVTYRPIKKTLEDKGVHPKVLKNFTAQIQTLIEDLPEGDVDNFVNYLNQRGARDKEVLWNLKDRRSNLFQGEGALPSVIASNVAKQLARHTGQDEKKRGVGQAELLMALIYDNIIAPLKGDLAVIKNIGDTKGVELEVKGNKAILGSLGNNISGALTSFFEEFSYFGIQYDSASKFTIEGGGKLRLNQMCLALAMAVRNSRDLINKHPNAFERIRGFIDELLTAAHQNSQPGTWINYDETNEELLAADINKAFGLSNFIRYAIKENFGYFLAIDYGKSGIGLPTDQGEYIFVGGDPQKMAKELWDKNVSFNPATPTAPGPRIEAAELEQSIYEGVLAEHLIELEKLDEELEY